MDCTSERIETYTEEFDMSAPTKKLKKEEVEAKQPFEERAAARGLEGAYDDDEPEYTLDMLIAVNPDYKGTPEKCNVTSYLPARGLEGAYDDDEPEYTLDMLTAENPDYKGTDKKCAPEKRECTVERKPNDR
ncbi:MAG: hypothetical protein OXL96_09280 [Candidatus Poribacteria bacterium]|nr:hypothetical protein [Candidatus Poribacteria bacterium]